MSSIAPVEPLHVASASPTADSQLLPGGPADVETDIAVLREVPHQFAVVDEKSANWLVRRIVAAREYAERVKEWAALEVRRAEREQQTLMLLYGRQAEAWAATEIAKFNGRRKSVNLPGGTIGFRRLPSRLVVDDEAAVMVWAREHCPPAIVVVEKLSKTIFDQYVKDTGHVPDGGVHVEPAGEKFYIR